LRRPSRIHRGLVGARDLVGQPYMGEAELRRQYEDEIAPRTISAVAKILDQWKGPVSRHVLDLGTGTGAVGLALRKRWPDVSIVAVDKVASPGVVHADVTRSPRPEGVEGRFDLVVAAHLLNELPLGLDARARLVLGWVDELLEPDGTVLLVEPALRQTSRDLLAVRDRLLGAGLFVVSPCLWQGPCPALAKERDFCHAAAPAVAQGRSRVDFSYLVVSRRGTPDANAELFRMVSDPMKDKGRLRWFGCGPSGRLLITRLDRDQSASNQALERAARGDVVWLRRARTSPGGIRCGPDCEVELLVRG